MAADPRQSIFALRGWIDRIEKDAEAQAQRKHLGPSRAADAGDVHIVDHRVDSVAVSERQASCCALPGCS